jgi:hypothetical protein
VNCPMPAAMTILLAGKTLLQATNNGWSGWIA